VKVLPDHIYYIFVYRLFFYAVLMLIHCCYSAPCSDSPAVLVMHQ